jgi:hypothetical protein
MHSQPASAQEQKWDIKVNRVRHAPHAASAPLTGLFIARGATCDTP